MFKPHFLWWQFFATQYLCLFRQHMHTEHTQHQILSSLTAHWARLRQRRIIQVPWAAVPGSSTLIAPCWLHTTGVAEHSRRQQLYLMAHTHTHTQHLWAPAGEHQNVSLLPSTPVTAVQLDTSWMGLSMPSPAAWGSCNVLSCPLNLVSGEISVPNWCVPPQRLKH